MWDMAYFKCDSTSVSRPSTTWETWLKFTWDMTKLHVRHDSTPWQPWLNSTWDMTQIHVRHDSTPRETWLNSMWDTIQLHDSHDSTPRHTCHTCEYRVAKTHRTPYLYRSFFAKEPYKQLVSNHFKMITTDKMSNKFSSRESPYISNTFSRESLKFQTSFHVSKRSPRHSKDLSGNLIDLEIQIFTVWSPPWVERLIIRTCVMTHSYVCHDSFVRVSWLIHVGDMTPSYVWHDSFICVSWLIRTNDETLLSFSFLCFSFFFMSWYETDE